MSSSSESPGRSFGMHQPGPDLDRGAASGIGDGQDEEGQLETLPDDALVDVEAEKNEVRISEALERLDRQLVGLAPVKTRVGQIAALLLVDRLRRRFDLGSSRPTLHMCFTGSPGTGKTTVATMMGELLNTLGYLRKGHLVSVTREDLVGQYVGHTAPKTHETIKRAMGGVLFIDEAYYLYRGENERDYGQETIEILLQMMENNREDLVVVLAGYKDKMDTFFTANPGMRSRIAHHIDFPDFDAGELMDIADRMLDQEPYYFSPEARDAFREYLDLRMSQPFFANARSVRNAIERIRLRHADRIVYGTSGKVGKDDLMRVEADDIRRSQVFAGPSEEDGR